MRKPLTKRQSEVYEIIRRLIQDKAYSPSLKEIGEASGCSIPVAHWLVKELTKKGYLCREKGSNRSIQLAGRAK